MGPHAIQVILEKEDHRELPQRRQIQGLVELAFVDGAVAEEADDSPVLLPVLDGQSLN